MRVGSMHFHCPEQKFVSRSPTTRRCGLKFERLALLVTMLTLLFSGAVWTAELPEAQIRTTTVAAFKNGLGFFIRQGQVRVAGGEGRILSVPPATLGTLWLAPNDPGATLEELVAYEQQTRHAAAVSLAGLLRSNPGKLVTVYSDGRDVTGEIVGFAPPTSASPSPSAERRIESSAVSGATPPPPEVLLLRTADGRVMGLHLSNVAQVSFPQNSALEVTRTEVAAALRFKINGAPENAHLTMGYLQKGFGWTPSYLVTLEDEKTARILMQAVVTNDAEDLRDTELFFVVGVPNFRYSEILSPMVLQQALAQALTDFRGGGLGSGGGVGADSFGALNAQISVNQRNAFEGDRSDADLRAAVADLEGAPEEDLFLYHRPRVTLARGERATYNVFNGTVAYEHIYEWDIPDTTHVDPYGNAQYNAAPPVDRARETTNDIWHSLHLTNGTQFPWTSAPALTLSANQPLAQDTLAYTPRGAQTNLKITIASDVRPHREELEVDRQIDALHAHGYSYDAVTVEGTVKVKNYKAKAIRLLIGKTLTGSVLSASDDGKSKRLAVAVQAENPTSQINWDLKFQPGAEKAITYRYKVLVRR